MTLTAASTLAAAFLTVIFRFLRWWKRRHAVLQGACGADTSVPGIGGSDCAEVAGSIVMQLAFDLRSAGGRAARTRGNAHAERTCEADVSRCLWCSTHRF